MFLIKLVVVGEGTATVGKTTLIVSYRSKSFPKEPVPTVDDGCKITLMLDEKTPVTINPWDTAGEPMYDRLRPLSYPQTHAFLLLFSLIDPASFENVRAKWEPEIRLHCPTAPFILVGTKLDLREDPAIVENLASKRLASISTEQGQEMARQVGARNYYEISSPQMVGVIEVFREAVGIVVEPQLKRSGRCHLM